MKKYLIWFLFLNCLLHLDVFSQNNLKTGTVFKEFGKTYEVNTPDFKTDLNADFKVIFDVDRSFNEPEKVNPLFDTAARFFNMHYEAGIPLENIQVALVVHGDASNDLLNDAFYEKMYGIKNPNTPLLKAFEAHDVQVILCGQTAAHRNLTKDKLLPQVDFALSAMTVLVQLQNENYRLIHF